MKRSFVWLGTMIVLLVASSAAAGMQPLGADITRDGATVLVTTTDCRIYLACTGVTRVAMAMPRGPHHDQSLP